MRKFSRAWVRRRFSSACTSLSSSSILALAAFTWWVVWAKDPWRRVGVGSAGGGELGAERVQTSLGLAGGCIDGAIDGIGVHAGEDAVAGFGENAGELGLGGGAGEIVERGGDLVVGGVEAEDAELLLELEHLLLRVSTSCLRSSSCLERYSETRWVESKRVS